MKNKELFDRTIGILVKAYHSGELDYGDCAKCAVGSLVFAANPYYNTYTEKTKWGRSVVFGTGKLTGADEENAEDTGYSLVELAVIEKAFYEGVSLFENATDKPPLSEDEENFNGLMSVVDCLMEIHEANTAEVTEAKSLFVKA